MSEDKRVVYVCAECDKNTRDDSLVMFHYCVSCLKKLLKRAKQEGVNEAQNKSIMKTVGESAELRKELFETCFKEEVEGIKKEAREEELKRLNGIIKNDTESFKLKWSDLERRVEVRVREEMMNKFKSFLKNHEVMFFGCDCSDCQTMEDDFEEKFLIKTGVQKE